MTRTGSFADPPEWKRFPFAYSFPLDISTLLKYAVGTMTALELLITMRDEWHCCPVSNEGRRMRPSNSELRRWCQSGSVLLCGERVTDPDEAVGFPITALVLFPKGARRTTII